MKWLWIVALGLAFVSANRAADGDAEWSEIVAASKAIRPPAEWSQKKPTAEEMADFKKKTAGVSTELADRLKIFYKKYPNHPKASDAWIKEQSLRQQVANEPAKAPGPGVAAPSVFKKRLEEEMERLKKAEAGGRLVAVAETERAARRLIKDYPNEPVGWELLAKAAEGMGYEKAAQLYAEVSTKAPTPKLKESAAARLKSLKRPEPAVLAGASGVGSVGKPLKLAFKTADGHIVDVSAMTGKVVLVDFWATWCGPCVAELPNVKRAYQELHEQGFEIVGVSFDEDCNELRKFVDKNDMDWPQFCDGGGWNNAINKDFGIQSIPTMYLVDKKGILRDTNARMNLEEKVKALLNE